jgi:cAMP-dependent protein kinase regulator
VLCAEEEIDIKALVNAKSEDDKARISEAIKASVIFNDITDEQKEMICSAMEHVDVKKGDWVIRQGEMGDRLYVVEEGEFEVRVLEKGRKDDGTGGSPVHVYFGSRSQHAHPTFGEIALRHSVPRQSSVIALTDGQLWALHRVVFNKILCYHNSRKEARHYLRKLSAFRMLTQDELQIVVDNLEEVSYAADQVIVEQGELGDAFYFIVKGSCGKSTKLFLYYGLLFISYMCCTGLFFVLSFHSFNLYYGRSDCE